MSQSHVAKRLSHQHNAGLKSLDLLIAVLFHVLVFTIIAVLAFWQQQHKNEPLKRIEVMMISAKDLAKLEHQAKPKRKTIKRPPVKAKAKKKKPKIKPKTKAKPKTKTPAPKAKAVVKIKPAKKTVSKAAKVDPDFDPFAPVVSSSNTTAPVKKATTSRPEKADIAGKQLSNSEKERYIALITAAVQQHWKVSASASKFNDPLVEMKLLPTGDIASIRILESSGNAAMDASLIRAINAAAPFELPRERYAFFLDNRMRFHPLQ
ncbi:MAG: TonB family protein [Mariprofundus sp.]|nr:TonB family protein [Mariprofundus sp.]